MNEKWTQGEWILRAEQWIGDESGAVIIAPSFAMATRQDEAKANALLIAAAPDLYVALHALLQQVPTLADDYPDVAAAVRALRKARGEAS